MPTMAQYLSLIPQEHRGKPRFVAMLTALIKPLVDTQQLLASLPHAFDLDTAAGVQLDAVGLWAGVSRFIGVPITGQFFAFDTTSLGFDQGRWIGPFDDTTGLARLDDDTYRLLIRARISANQWDGTLQGAADALAYVFASPLTHVFIQDNQDQTYTLNVAGVVLEPLQMSILTGGYIPLKPAGYRLAGVISTSVSGGAIFGFDTNNSSVSGFDVGAWGV